MMQTKVVTVEAPTRSIIVTTFGRNAESSLLRARGTESRGVHTAAAHPTNPED
jgi:hypothetical protein